FTRKINWRRPPGLCLHDQLAQASRPVPSRYLAINRRIPDLCQIFLSIKIMIEDRSDALKQENKNVFFNPVNQQEITIFIFIYSKHRQTKLIKNLLLKPR